MASSDPKTAGFPCISPPKGVSYARPKNYMTPGVIPLEKKGGSKRWSSKLSYECSAGDNCLPNLPTPARCGSDQNLGGGVYYDTCGGHKFEHAQSIAALPSKGDGKIYFAVPHSQDYYGSLLIYAVDARPAPNEHLMVETSQKPGKAVYFERYDQCHKAGAYNHPGDVAVVGRTMYIAAQNWDGGEGANLDTKFMGTLKTGIGCRLKRDDDRPTDAILFYDVTDPAAPKYSGKIDLHDLEGQQRIKMARSSLDGTGCNHLQKKYGLCKGNTEYDYQAESLTVAEISGKLYMRVNSKLYVSTSGGGPDPQEWSVTQATDMAAGFNRHFDATFIAFDVKRKKLAAVGMMGGDDDYTLHSITKAGLKNNIDSKNMYHDADELEYSWYVSPRGRSAYVSGRIKLNDDDKSYTIQMFGEVYPGSQVDWDSHSSSGEQPEVRFDKIGMRGGTGGMFSRDTDVVHEGESRK